MKCEVCGKKFTIGNNPITGIPNGLGLKFEETSDKVFEVCSFCMAYRNKKMIEIAEEWKRKEAENE